MLIVLLLLLLPLPARAVHPDVSPGSAWRLSGRVLADGVPVLGPARTEVMALAAGRPQLLGERFLELVFPSMQPAPSRSLLSAPSRSQSAVASRAVRPVPPACLGHPQDMRMVFPSERLDLLRLATFFDLGPSSSLAVVLLMLSEHGHVGLPEGRVAATGVVLPDGSVAPVSGLAGKMSAARRAGVSLVVVPEGSGSFARSSGADVLEVSHVSDLMVLLPSPLGPSSCAPPG